MSKAQGTSELQPGAMEVEHPPRITQSMNLKNAELITEEFNKLALVESAEVVPNSEGDWSVRIIATFSDSSIACKVLGTARAEEDFGTM